MKYLGERQAENLLEKEEFNVVLRAFCSSKSGVRRAINKVKTPFIMKATGSKIQNKVETGAINFGVKTYSNALEEFFRLKKIRGSEGVLFQSKIKGKKYFVGSNKTSEFGHVVSFGEFNEGETESKDVSFAVVPLTKADARELIKSTKISKGLLKPDGKAIEEVVLKVSELVEKYPKIFEVKLHPIFVEKGLVTVVDAKISKE